MLRGLRFVPIALALVHVPIRAEVSGPDWDAALKKFKGLMAADATKVEALGVLAAVDDVRAVKAIEGVCVSKQDAIVEVREACARALKTKTDAKAIDYIVKVIATSADLRVRALFFSAVPGGLDANAKVTAAVLEAAKAKEETTRAFAIRAISRSVVANKLELVANALSDKHPYVRMHAIHGLLECDPAPAVDLLIEQLKKESGRLRLDIHKALRALTTAEKSQGSPEQWATWWGSTGKRGLQVNAGDSPSVRFNDIRKVTLWRDISQDVVESDVPLCGEIPIYSKRLVFIVDKTGSQLNNFEGKLRSYTVVIGGKRVAFDASTIKTEDHYVCELMRHTLSQLDDSHQFSIVFYNETVSCHSPVLLKATPANVESAIKAIASQAPTRASNVIEALDAGLMFAEREKSPVNVTRQSINDNPDSIVLIGDLWPTAGRILWKRPGIKGPNENWVAEMLAEVAKINDLRCVSISVAGPTNVSTEFSEQLVSRFHGELYVYGEK